MWFIAVASADGSVNPTPARIVGYAALAVAVALVAVLHVARRRAPGRRMLSAVRAAGRADASGLAGGVPGPAGRFLVLRGRDGAAERVELVHVRARPGTNDGRVEARTLARRRVWPGDAVTAGETTGAFSRVADAATHVARGRLRDARGLRRLNRALARATAERYALALRREPLAWAAGACVVAVVVAAARHVLGISDDPLAHGLGNMLLAFTWPLSMIVLLWACARAVHDPYGDR